MNKYLKTQEMKEYIQNKGRLSGESAIMIWDFNIYFEKAGKNKLPGKYIYSDKSGYHNVDIGDRGGLINMTFKAVMGGSREQVKSSFVNNPEGLSLLHIHL